MVEDWNSVEKFLGGKADALQPSDIPVNNAHAKNMTELFLSDSSKFILCQTLCNEIQVYKDIIKRAINFNDNDRHATIEELLKSCPKEAMSSACAENRPRMRHKIYVRRGVSTAHYSKESHDRAF